MTDLLQDLRAAFTGRLLTAPADMAPFLTDWRNKWTGSALAVAQPDDAGEVAAVVRWCAAHAVAIVPQGGNTGLAGGATPSMEGTSIVLSLARLNRIRAIDTVNNTMEVEAGVTLQAIQEAAQAQGRLFPLSLAAQGSCTIGGNLATNAGGVQVLRYGNARDLCLGLEVVTADGDVWHGLRGLRKDNTGYDLRDLFIGSEGTLGVITGAVLKLWPRPAAKVVAFVATPTPEAAVRLLQAAQESAGERLTAFELIGDECVGLVERHVDGARLPLRERSPWYVLLEIVDNRAEAAAQQALEELLGPALEDGSATDAAISASLGQFDALWSLRESISEAQGAEGPAIKHDISLPISALAEFIEATSAAVPQRWPQLRPVVFGHMGDGNLHFNFSPSRTFAGSKTDFYALEPEVNRFVHDRVAALDGSISAEHGLGVLRRDEAVRYKSAVEMKLMKTIKAALDPMNLMNPGKQLG